MWTYINTHTAPNEKNHLSLSIYISLSMDSSVDASVSGGGPAGPLFEEFVPGETTEGGEDVSLEWLSIYMEDCLSGTTSYNTTSQPLPPPTPSHHDTPSPNPPQPQNPTKTSSSSSFHDLAIPAKARTKRRRVTTPKALISQQDPLLFFHQTCWLADSELILPKKEQENKAPGMELLVGGAGEAGEKIGKEQQIRRCSHCLSHKTPQWRAGPLGPKTLCNACGVRFKSGRLLPEYRPAKSPTFVSYKHSNSHKKVMEMRMMAILSSQSN